MGCTIKYEYKQFALSGSIGLRLFRKEYLRLQKNIWILPYPTLLNQEVPTRDLLLSVNWCDVSLISKMYT